MWYPASVRKADGASMYDFAPLSRLGCRLFANASLSADLISSVDRPAIAKLVLSESIGRIDRAAWGLRHTAPLTFGFQSSGQPNGPVQLRSTRQTNPLVPLTAVS